MTDGKWLGIACHERGHFLFLVWACFSLYIIQLEVLSNEFECSVSGEFVTLTEKKNFLEAAECLFISQSCLSKHIKKLETEIGVELFERTTRTVVLTEFGQMLLPYARKMVSLEYEFEKNVHRKIHQDSRQYCAWVDSFNETARDYGTDCRIFK